MRTWCSEGYFFAGNPDTVFTQLQTFYEKVGGFGNFMMMVQGGTMGYDLVERSMRRFAEHVLPRFRSEVFDRRHRATAHPRRPERTSFGGAAMIVVVGLGNIGIAIAARIAECGNDVLGVDLAADRRSEWQRITGRAAVASLADVPWPDVARVYVVVRLTNQAESVLQQLLTLPLVPGIPVFLNTTLELDYARGLGALRRRPVAADRAASLGR